MKIKKIYYKNHPLFKDLVIDLSRENGACYNKILIIGKNGSGKTTFLKGLFNFLLGKSFEFEKIEYINDEGESLIAIKSPNYNNGFHTIYKNGNSKPVNANYNNNANAISTNKDDLRKNGVIYSSAEIDFKTKKISSISSLDLNQKDRNLYDYSNNKSDFTEIKQLLIDLEAQDSELFTSMSKEKDIKYSDFETSFSKIHIFKSAINNFFEELKYKGLITNNGHKEIVFNKCGKDIFLDDLSSGEKQIVFRGVIILRDLAIHQNGFVLIDEPELSMHPSWCNKIFKYYSDLLFNRTFIIGQLIIATHSERIISECVKDSNALIVGLNFNDGNIDFKKYSMPIVLPYISDSEIFFNAFDIYSYDFFIQLYNYMQSKFSLTKVMETDTFIKNNCFYDVNLHYFPTSFNNFNYETLPTAIRNALHHNNNFIISMSQLKIATDLLLKICK